jgi:hypothetical protein
MPLARRLLGYRQLNPAAIEVEISAGGRINQRRPDR